MGNFRQDYELAFGPIEYEPLEPERFIDNTKRRALNIQGTAPTASPRAQAIPLPMSGPPLEEEQGAISGLLKTGTGMLGEATLGAGEYALDKAADVTGAESLGTAADFLQEQRDSLAQWRQSIYDRMNPEVIDSKGREFLTLDPDRTIWRGGPGEVGKSIMYKLVEQVPMTMATMVPGGLMLRAGSKGALTYLGASEAGLSVGFIQNEIKDGIAQMSDEELMSESPRFTQLAKQFGIEEARNRFEAEATGMAPVIGGMVVGAIGAAAGRYLEPVLTGTGNYGAIQRFGRGFVSEGVFQEAPQESVEQLASNAARAAYDGDIELLDGVAEAAVQGIAVGGPMGGTFGVLAGRSGVPEDAPPPPEGTTPVERDVPDEPTGPKSQVTLPETDLLGGKVVSVDNRDPLAEWDDPLTLKEELEAAGYQDPRDKAMEDINAFREKQILQKPKSRRTKAEKQFLESRGLREERRQALQVRAGPDPAIEAATAAAVGRMGRNANRYAGWLRQGPDMGQSGRRFGEPGLGSGTTYQPDMLELDAAEQQRMAKESVDAAYGAAEGAPQRGPTPDPNRPGPVRMGGQMEIPGLGPAEPAQELTGYTTRGGTDRVLVEPQQPTRAFTDEDMLPTELDQPTAEPLADIQAQLTAMDNGERDGVYISAPTVERYPRLLDKSAATVPNFDGQGGAVVFPDEATAASYIERRNAGEDMQLLLGEITGAGEGKPISSTAVTLQQLDEQGNVKRESLVESPEAAQALQEEWSAPTTVSTARVTPLLETTDAPIGEVEKRYGEFAEDMNYVEKLDANGEVIERRLVRGEQETNEVVAEYEQEEGGGGAFRVLSPEETLLRRERMVQEDRRFPVEDQVEFESRQLDLFDYVPEIISQARDPKVKKVGPRVRVMDGNIVLWEKVFRAGFEKEAEQVVKQLEEEIGGTEGLSIWKDTSRKREKESYTPVMQRGARVATRGKAKESYKRVDKSLAEQVQEKLGSELSAKDIKEVTEGATDLDEVADRLIEKGKQAEEIDRRNRIGTMFNPDKLTFISEETKSTYEEQWQKAVDATLRIELAKKLNSPNRRKIIRAAENDLAQVRTAITKLRKARGPSAWKKEVSPYLKQARSVSPKRARGVVEAARRRAEPKKTAEEEDVEELWRATQEEQAQREIDIREEAYGDTEYDVSVTEATAQGVSRSSGLVREGLETSADVETPSIASEEAITEAGVGEQLYFDGKYTYKYTRRLLDEGVLSNDDLIELLENAMRYRYSMYRRLKDMEADSALIAKARAGKANQSEIIKNIARAAKTAREQDEAQGVYKGESVILPTEKGRTKKGVSTKALTKPRYVADESVEGKTARIEAARTLRKSLKEKSEKAIKRADSTKVDAVDNAYTKEGEPLPTTTGVKQIMALEYIRQLAQLAMVAAENGSSDSDIVALMSKLDTALTRAANFDKNELATFWYKIATDQSNLTAKLRGVEWRQRGNRGLDKEVKQLPNGMKIGKTGLKSQNEAERYQREVRRNAGVSLRADVKKTKSGWRVRFYRQEAMVNKQNQAAYYELLDQWRKNPDFNNFIWPLVQRMTAAVYSAQGIYAPTREEVQVLNWLLQKWDANDKTKQQLSQPLRKLLRNVGRIEFDGKTGQVVEDYHLNGRLKMNLPENFDLRERHYNDVREITGKTPAPETRGLSELYEIKRPTRDLLGKRIPWNKKLPYEQGGEPEATPEARPTQKESGQLGLFAPKNIASNAPTDIKLLQAFRKFRKVIDHSRSTINSLIDAEEKLIETMKQLGIDMNFANFSGLIRITLPNGQTFTYRRAAQDLGDRRITKDQAKARMRSITKRMAFGTAAQRSYIANNPGMKFDLPIFDDSYTYTYELKNYAKSLANENTKTAATKMGDALLNRRNPPNVNQLLDIISSEATGPFAVAANKLRRLALKDVKVKWSEREKGNLGHYDPKTRTIYLNFNTLVDSRNDLDFFVDAKAVHTVIHETAHAATLHALRTNKVLNESMDILRTAMANRWNASRFGEEYGGEASDWAQASYGLRNVEEFVAEIFGNSVFQDMAKKTPLQDLEGIPRIDSTGRTTVFQRFKRLVGDFLGFTGEMEENVFDMVMALSDQLFEGAGQITGGPSVDLKDLTAKSFDAWASKSAAQGWDRLDSALGIEDRVRSSMVGEAIYRGTKGKWQDKFTSMSQLVQRFGDKLPSLVRYNKAFRARNARNAELMQVPEKVSREWTSLQEDEPGQARKLSEVMTQASLNAIDPTVGLSHERNKHIKSPRMKSLHADLRAEYEALSPAAKKIWGKAREYYATALKRETAYLLLNALRGITSKKISEAEFDRKYNESNIMDYATKDAMKREFGDIVKDVDLDAVRRLATVPELKKGVYFPLSRYGDYAVEAKKTFKSKTFSQKSDANAWVAKYKEDDPTFDINVYPKDGKWVAEVNERVFSLFESALAARNYKDELAEEFGENNVTLTRKYKRYTEAAIGSNKELQSILAQLTNNPAAQAAIKNFYLRNLADTSMRKREINRKQVRGVDPGAQHRNFANYAKQASYYTAQLQYGWQMAEALRDMKADIRNFEGSDADRLRLGMVRESVEERDGLSQDLVQVNPAVRKLLGATQFWMLTSASYHMINSSQPWMVTMPIMAAKHGLSKTFTAMRVAQSKVIGTVKDEALASGFGVKALTSQAAAEKAFGVYDQLVENIKTSGDPRANDYLVMLEELRRNHILEVSPMTELREIASGEEGLGSRVLDASRIMAHLVEINNRVLTAVAAYDLEMAASGDKQKARDYAAEMIETTQFNYSTANKPPAFQQVPLMFQFMQWTQHIYALMIQNTYNSVKGKSKEERRQAQKALAGLFGTHAMVGGVLGVSLQPVKMALGLVALMFSDEDDPITVASALSGEWYDRTVTSGLASVMGSDLAMMASRGLPMALGTDLSTRMSLGTLYFVDLRSEDPQHVVGSLVMSFGGAPLSQVMQWSRGANMIVNGEVMKGVETMAPKIFRDLMRAGRYATEGLVNNAGDTVIPTKDMSPWQLGLLALGFAPEQVSRFYAGQAAIKSEQAFVRDRRAELLKAFRTAETPNERLKARKDIREFNRRWRRDPIMSSSLEATKKSKAIRERGYDKYGAGIDPKKARQYAKAGEPYQ